MGYPLQVKGYTNSFDTKEPGLYNTSNETGGNSPVITTFMWGNLIVIHNGAYTSQFYYAQKDSSVYMRVLDGATREWKPWNKFNPI